MSESKIDEADVRLAGPIEFNLGLFIKVCMLYADGMTLSKACLAIHETDGFAINPRAIRYWCLIRDDAQAIYARARVAHLDRMEEQIVTIADEREEDIVRDIDGAPVLDGRGRPLVHHENVMRSRLRVETRKWLLSKLRPETFGDNYNVTQNVNVKTVPVTEDELSKLQDDWLKDITPDKVRALN